MRVTGTSAGFASDLRVGDGRGGSTRASPAGGGAADACGTRPRAAAPGARGGVASACTVGPSPHRIPALGYSRRFSRGRALGFGSSACPWCALTSPPPAASPQARVPLRGRGVSTYTVSRLVGGTDTDSESPGDRETSVRKSGTGPRAGALGQDPEGEQKAPAES